MVEKKIHIVRVQYFHSIKIDSSHEYENTQNRCVIEFFDIEYKKTTPMQPTITFLRVIIDTHARPSTRARHTLYVGLTFYMFRFEK